MQEIEIVESLIKSEFMDKCTKYLKDGYKMKATSCSHSDNHSFYQAILMKESQDGVSLYCSDPERCYRLNQELNKINSERLQLKKFINERKVLCAEPGCNAVVGIYKCYCKSHRNV